MEVQRNTDGVTSSNIHTCIHTYIHLHLCLYIKLCLFNNSLMVREEESKKRKKKRMKKCIRLVYQYNRIAKKRKKEVLESLLPATLRLSECEQSTSLGVPGQPGPPTQLNFHHLGVRSWLG